MNKQLENGESATNTVMPKKVVEQPAGRKTNRQQKIASRNCKIFYTRGKRCTQDTIYPDTNIPSNLSVDSNNVPYWAGVIPNSEKTCYYSVCYKKKIPSALIRLLKKQPVPETTVPAPQPTQNSTGNPIEKKTIYPTTIDL